MPPATRHAPTDAGLPPAGKARLARFASTRARTSLLSTPSAFGLAAVGLEPVGDVMGCIGSQLGAEYLDRCQVRSRRGGELDDDGTSPIVVVNGATSYTGSYVRQLRGLYATALSRLIGEARSVQADGIVDVDLSLKTHDDLYEVVAVGTAVRARSRTRPRRPFVTDLAGTQVARLMQSGWVPVDLHVAIAVVLRHLDTSTSVQLGRPNRRNNVELTAWSELNARSYAVARSLLATATTKAGADGCLLTSHDNVQWSRSCTTMMGADRVARCTLIGTSVARYHAPSPPPMLRIMPLEGDR